jgi:hypothetical protein
VSSASEPPGTPVANRPCGRVGRPSLPLSGTLGATSLAPLNAPPSPAPPTSADRADHAGGATPTIRVPSGFAHGRRRSPPGDHRGRGRHVRAVRPGQRERQGPRRGDRARREQDPDDPHEPDLQRLDPPLPPEPERDPQACALASGPARVRRAVGARRPDRADPGAARGGRARRRDHRFGRRSLGTGPRQVALDQARIERQIRELGWSTPPVAARMRPASSGCTRSGTPR